MVRIRSSAPYQSLPSSLSLGTMDPPLPLVVKAEDDYHDVDEPSAIGISMISSEEGSANKTNDVVELDGPAAPTSMLPQATGPSAASMPTSSDATTSEEIKITEQVSLQFCMKYDFYW